MSYQPIAPGALKVTVTLTRSEAEATLSALSEYRKTFGPNIVDKPGVSLPNQRASRAVNDALEKAEHDAFIAEAMHNVRQRNNMTGKRSGDRTLIAASLILGFIIGAGIFAVGDTLGRLLVLGIGA